MSPITVSTTVVTALALIVGLAGCGDTMVKLEAPDQGNSNSRAAATKKDEQRPRVVVVRESNPAPIAAPAPVSSSSGFTKDCGYGIRANGVTTCEFAMNVHSAWDGGGPGIYTATSPVTGRTYDMSCDVGSVSVVCSEVNSTDGSNDAAVAFYSYD